MSYDEKPYLVHHEGPDDIEYFDTWVEAFEYARAVNNDMADYYRSRPSHPGMVRSWAIPYLSTEYVDRWDKILGTAKTTPRESTR